MRRVVHGFDAKTPELKLTRSLIAKSRRNAKAGFPRRWYLTDPTRSPDPAAIVRRLPAGSGVILRHYDHPEREVLAKVLGHICRQRHIVFLIAGDARLAQRIKADGIHLPDRTAARAGTRRRRNPYWIVSIAIHSRASIGRYIDADIGFISPVFPTDSHAAAPGLGPVRLAGLTLSAAPLSCFALGGVNEMNFQRLRGVRVKGFGGIACFNSALDQRSSKMAEWR